MAHIQALKERVAELDRQLEKLATQPAVAVLLSLPGIGLRTALAIVGDTGQPSRFRNTHHYVAYCGLAPAMHQSGGGGPSPKSRQRYNRHLKRAFLLIAFSQIRWNDQARCNYERKRASGKSHWAALRSLARQLCRIIFSLLVGTARFDHRLNRQSPIDIEDSKSHLPPAPLPGDESLVCPQPPVLAMNAPQWLLAHDDGA